MPSRKKTIQTTLTNNETAWKTIGRAKRNVTSTAPQTDLKDKKKTDIKLTPPRLTEQVISLQKPLKTPLPESPTASSDSSLELNLIANINSFNASKKIGSLKRKEFPTLPSLKLNTAATKEKNKVEVQDMMKTDITGGFPEVPKKENKGEDQEEMQIAEIDDTSADDDMEVASEDSYSAFTKLYPQDYPPDWSISPANNYVKPTSSDIDAIDSSLLPENEKRIALCLYPFSKEFFIATGFSKLQLPDDYQQLTRVIVWHNRQRLKKGLSVLKPKEFVKFLFSEMSQDFSDLGIDIPDFLDDLIKVRHSENIAFDNYNSYIKNQTIPSTVQLNNLQQTFHSDNKVTEPSSPKKMHATQKVQCCLEDPYQPLRIAAKANITNRC
jgi:hypothetical protein